MQHIIDRFISYVTIDTESDPNSDTTPSTKKQLDLANLLVKELKTEGGKRIRKKGKKTKGKTKKVKNLRRTRKNQKKHR